MKTTRKWFKLWVLWYSKHGSYVKVQIVSVKILKHGSYNEFKLSMWYYSNMGVT